MDHLQRHVNHDRINYDGMPSQPWAGDFAATTLEHTRPALARHYLRHWEASKMPGAETVAPPQLQGPVVDTPAGQLPGVGPLTQRLDAGRAVTLRASQLSVLRIAHGRVWVTLTDVGPWSRVLAGDHFLSRGESMTLLPGQALVMESFSADAAAPAQFTWQAPGVCVGALPSPPLVSLRAGIREPWLDLRHATGLALGAAGRLVHGFGQVASAALAPVLTPIAMIFIAASAQNKSAGSVFSSKNCDSAASCRLS